MQAFSLFRFFSFTQTKSLTAINNQKESYYLRTISPEETKRKLTILLSLLFLATITAAIPIPSTHPHTAGPSVHSNASPHSPLSLTRREIAKRASLNAGTIVGIVLGALSGLWIIIYVSYCFLRLWTVTNLVVGPDCREVLHGLYFIVRRIGQKAGERP